MSGSARRLLTGVAGAAGAIAVLTVASRVLGFGRWMVQSATVGPFATGDAYASANLLPNVLYEVVAGGALAGAVVPLLATPISRKLQGQVDEVASALLTWSVVVLVPVGAVVALLAGPIASALPVPADGDPASTQAVTAYFLRVFSPQIPLYGVGIVLTGILQAHRRFVAPAVVPIASTLVVIVSYLAFDALANGLQAEPDRLSDGALAVLAWGTTAGVVALSLPLLIPVRRTGLRLRPRLSFPPGVGRRARSLALAGIGGVLAQQVAVLVVMLLARGYGVDGTFVVFQFTQAVYLLPYAVLAVPLVTVFQPRLAELSGESEGGGVGDALARLAERSTRTVIAAGLFGTAVLVAVAPAAHAVFTRLTSRIGEADPVAGMTQALTWMAPGVVGLGLLLHAGRMLLALDRSRASVAATAAAWIATALAAVIAVTTLTPRGEGVATLSALGSAHAVGMTLGGLAVLLVLRGIMPGGFTRGLLRTLAVGGVTAAVGGAVGRFAVDTVLDLGERSVPAAVMAALLGTLVVTLATVVGMRTFDRAILASVRGAHG